MYLQTLARKKTRSFRANVCVRVCMYSVTLYMYTETQKKRPFEKKPRIYHRYMYILSAHVALDFALFFFTAFFLSIMSMVDDLIYERKSLFFFRKREQ